jgi:predicted amidohydrolase
MGTLCQIDNTVGDLPGNSTLILEFARQATARGAELAVTGYPSAISLLLARLQEGFACARRGPASHQKGILLAGPWRALIESPWC